MMTKHFLAVVLMTAFASVAIRLWLRNAPISAAQAGLTGCIGGC